MTQIKSKVTLVTHQWTFLINIGYIFHNFLILTNSSLHMNEPLKGTDCFHKSLDGISTLPDKVYVTSGAGPWERSEAGGVNDNERHLRHSPVSSPTEELRKE